MDQKNENLPDGGLAHHAHDSPLQDRALSDFIALGYVLERIHWSLVSRGYAITNGQITPPRNPLILQDNSYNIDYTNEDKYTSWITQVMREIDWPQTEDDLVDYDAIWREVC